MLKSESAAGGFEKNKLVILHAKHCSFPVWVHCIMISACVHTHRCSETLIWLNWLNLESSEEGIIWVIYWM